MREFDASGTWSIKASIERKPPSTFEELAFILRGCREPERFCVYIDTAHLFAAGCDLDSDEGITRTFAQFKRLIWGALCNFNH